MLNRVVWDSPSRLLSVRGNRHYLNQIESAPAASLIFVSHFLVAFFDRLRTMQRQVQEKIRPDEPVFGELVLAVLAGRQHQRAVREAREPGPATQMH